MRNFREYAVWKSGMELAKQVYRIVKDFPQTERFGLSDQIKRGAISIPSNIAEGCSRTSTKEFAHFLEIAIGSSFELETQLILSGEMGFVDEEPLMRLLQELEIMQKQLNKS